MQFPARAVRFKGNGRERTVSTTARITQAQRDRLFDLAMANRDSEFSRRILRWLDGVREL